MSDMAVYDQVLSAEQIATLYSAATVLFYDVTLSGNRTGTSLVLNWPGNGRLLQSTNVSGPWTTNLSSSPATLSPQQPRMFYRVQTR